MIIAVDIDEVLGDLWSVLLVHYEERYGKKFERSDFTSYDIWEIFQCTEEESIRRVMEFAKEGGYSGLTPFPGARDALEKLNKDHTLIVVSARFDFLEKETNDWIEEHFPGIFSEVHVTNEYNPKQSREKKNKGQVCKEKKVDIIIEDALHHAHDCVRNGTRVLLFDAPWNQGALPQSIVRVHSWNDILTQLE